MSEKVEYRDCHCKSQPSYQTREVRETHENPEIQDCICAYLDAYVDFAESAGSVPEKVIDDLFEKTRDLIATAIIVEGTRIAALTRHGGETWQELTHWLNHIRNPDLNNLNTLVEMAEVDEFTSEPRTIKRVDKVTFVERFINLSHKSDYLLSSICEYKANGVVRLGFVKPIITEVLDCLEKSGPSPDQIMARMKEARGGGWGKKEVSSGPPKV